MDSGELRLPKNRIRMVKRMFKPGKRPKYRRNSIFEVWRNNKEFEGKPTINKVPLKTSWKVRESIISADADAFQWRWGSLNIKI